MLLKVFRPNLIDVINLSKVLDNYTKRCKYTSGDLRMGLVCGGGGWGRGHQFFSKKIFSLNLSDIFALADCELYTCTLLKISKGAPYDFSIDGSILHPRFEAH